MQQVIIGKQSHFDHMLAKYCLKSWLHQVGIVHGESAGLYCLKGVTVAVCVSEGGTEGGILPVGLHCPESRPWVRAFSFCSGAGR